MERKGGLRVGEDGLIGGNLHVSLRTLPPLIFLNTHDLSRSATKAIINNTKVFCTLLMVPFND